MQKLDLNLATRPFRNNTLLWAGLALALIAIGAVTMMNVRTFLNSTEGLARLRERAGDVESRRADLDRRDGDALREIGRHELGPLFVRTDKANEVIRWKAFSWTRLFNLLQEVQPYGVQMASIQPVFRAERGGGRTKDVDPEIVPVTVEGMARGLDDFLEFQAALLLSANFDRVEPVRMNTDINTGETVFQLRFHYDPRIAEQDGESPAVDPEEEEPAPEVEPDDVAPGEEVPVDEGSVAVLDDVPPEGEASALALPTTDALAADAGTGDAPDGGTAAEESPVEPPASTAVAQPETAEEKPVRKRNPRRRGRRGKNNGPTPVPEEQTAGPADPDDAPDEGSDDDRPAGEGS